MSERSDGSETVLHSAAEAEAEVAAEVAAKVAAAAAAIRSYSNNNHHCSTTVYL